MAWGTRKIVSFVGEVVGTSLASYLATSRKLKEQQKLEVVNDFYPEETKTLLINNLDQCKPVSDDLTRMGRMAVKDRLEKNDYFGTLLSIDSSTKPTKRALCIVELKTAVKCICSGYNADALRAATYNYLTAGD